MPIEPHLLVTKGQMFDAFKEWLSPLGGAFYTDDEWAALTLDEKASVYTDYFIKLLTQEKANAQQN